MQDHDSKNNSIDSVIDQFCRSSMELLKNINERSGTPSSKVIYDAIGSDWDFDYDEDSAI